MMLSFNKFRPIYIGALLLVFTTACTNGQALDQQSPEPLGVKQTNYAGYQQQPLNQLIIDQFEDIIEVTSVMNDEELLMAIKVDQVAQFNEQTIAEEVESYIKESDQNMKPKVSSDLKVFVEIDRLKYDLADQNLSKKEYDKAFKNLKKLLKTP
ncbi:hypothetical protein [Amphibacillus cookii]|uniref:hypothetical protein n=1 Tax=Amphibacillus cookii TaxID=767787 RepID=UPI00195C7DDA|nr:hypothetical protein [Amphibacillus cookii]MBM7540403.1 hypothetical protein [Amphibacillus cookii]